MYMNDKKYFKVIAISMLAIMLGFSLNSISFLRKINAAAEESLAKSNQYLVSHIVVEIAGCNKRLEDFADSLSRMPEFLLTEDLLKQKGKMMGFESIAVIAPGAGMQAAYGPHGEELAQDLHEDAQRILENDCVLSGEEQAVFAAPVTKDGKVVQIVAGAEPQSALFQQNELENYGEKAVLVLKDTQTGAVLWLRQGSHATIIEEQKLSELLDLAENSRDGQVVRQGTFIISKEPVDGTSWAQIMIQNTDDRIAQMSLHVSIYLLLLGLALLLFGVGMRRLKQDIHQKEKLLLTDPITGGLNRNGFLKAGAHALKASPEQDYAVVCLNICNFRKINEVWGEEEGNRTLIYVYQMFRQILQKDEVLCRDSIDHFLFLLREEPSDDIQVRIHRIIAQIHNHIHRRYQNEGMDFSVGCYQLHKSQDLLSAINYAARAAKEAPEKNLCNVYDHAMMQALVYETELDASFRDSIANREFKVFLQPKVALEGPCQAEALVRWLHPEKGMIYPNQFIPMLERSGKIVQLDLYIFEETCRLMSNWLKNGETPTKISVNMSRFTLLKFGTEVWKEYKKIKDAYQIPDHFIEIEVTETIVFTGSQMGYISRNLDGFHSCGLYVSLDDFGFGYSSLFLLRVLDIDTIKLDRSFFVDENEKSRAIVTGIIQFAHQFKICVVAEGVEEQQQAETLYQSGCDLIQGYVYSPPLSVEDFIKWREVHEKQKH